MADHGYLNARHLEHLADRCERGAADLLHEADNAAEVLATRAGGDRISPDDWAAQKRSAAAAATAYGRQLRQEAAELGLGRVSQERIAEAERVASAAELGGILIDGRPMAVRAAQDGWPWAADAEREAWNSGTHPAQENADEMARSGAFVRVAETIDGIEQVPFWRLAAGDDQGDDRHQEAAGGQDDAEPMTRQDYKELGANLRDEAESMWANGDRSTDATTQVEMYDEARHLDTASAHAEAHAEAKAGELEQLVDEDQGDDNGRDVTEVDEALQHAIEAAEARLGEPLSATARQDIVDGAAEIRAAAARENARTDDDADDADGM